MNNVVSLIRALPIVGLVAASVACSRAPAASASSAANDAEPKAMNAGSGPAGESSAATGASPASNPGGADVAGSTLAAGNTKEDAHWVQADDYFVASRAFDKGWQYVNIAKLKEPAAPGADGAALFFIIKDGSEQRLAHFYRTRPAVKSDLALGSLLICFDDNKRKDVYLAPRNKDNARPGTWWMARITDLSDLEKGYATLAGSYHCAPDALRAIVK